MAALSVLTLHSSAVSTVIATSSLRPILAHLNVGVAIFFVISGFLLYRPFVAGRIVGSRPGFARYFRRRLLRIVPAYWLALTTLTIYPGLHGVFTSNWWIYYGVLQAFIPVHECLRQASGCGIPQAWSLSVELACYALLPTLTVFLGVWGHHHGHSRAGHFEPALLLMAAGVCIPLTMVAPPTGPFYPLVSSMPWFLLGMAVAVLSVAVREGARTVRILEIMVARPTLLWVMTVAVFALACYGILPASPSQLDQTPLQRGLLTALFGAVAVGLLLPAVFGQQRGGLIRTILRNRSLVWLGTISYGIYLWHLTIMVKLHDMGVEAWFAGQHHLLFFTAMTLVPTIACAAISFYLIERPILRLERHRATSRGALSPARGEGGQPQVDPRPLAP